MSPRVSYRLLEQVYKIWRAELTQRGQRLCPRINGLMYDFLSDPEAQHVSAHR